MKCFGEPIKIAVMYTWIWMLKKNNYIELLFTHELSNELHGNIQAIGCIQ